VTFDAGRAVTRITVTQTVLNRRRGAGARRVQVNDIFAAANIGGTVATDALMIVFSNVAVIPYVTVIDNVTGDSVVQGPKSF